MKTGNFKKELQRAGCKLWRHGANHDVWYSPITDTFDSLPRHDTQELPKGLERRLRKKLLGK